jgi:outer membrane protein
LRPARTGAAVAGAAALLLAATDAAAEGGTSDEVERPPPSGLRIGLRSGLALPIGEAFTAGGALSSTVTGYVPVRLDLGLRYRRHVYVGVVAQLGYVVPAGCPSGGSCSGTDARLGVLLAFHLLPTRLVDPWLGIGMGYETLSITRAMGGASVDFTARGLELLDLEVGADVRPTPALRLGPVLSTSIGRFTKVTLNDVPTRDFDPSLHAWVMLGLRGALDL